MHFQKNPKPKTRKEELKKCTAMNASGKKIKEDGIVMICKNVKCFWNEEQNNQFSTPREDRN